METEGSRLNGRPLTKLRPVSIKFGLISSADGSSEFSLGNTRVLAAVHGPVAAKTRHEQIDRSVLKVTVESFDSAPSLKDVAMAQKLEKMIQSVVFDLLHPRTMISITIQPLSLDGSYFAVAFNAAICALLDSAVPMIRMAFAASCLLDTQGNIIIDPDQSEEQSQSLNRSEHLIIFDPSNLNRSLSQNHFGKFDLASIGKVSKVLADEAILPISEEIKNQLGAKIERL